ncbi:hypothetical protein BGZ94_001312 [Podila epigama]|nr:hypothetical protein BGZ94_001312 [Podila epigama]
MNSTLPSMPENVWLDIFGYLTLEEKSKVAGTCRMWRRILTDPLLYAHITLDHMEFNTLVRCMKHLCHLAPRIRSLRISNCFSHFISKTTVPVQNTSMAHHFPQHPGMHSLYSHITSLTPARRREEYRKLGFTLHQKFSASLVALMEHSQETLKYLEIRDNFLDLEMTELIFCIVRYGRRLEHILYDANKDDGFVAPEVVSAITAACPSIRSFRGHHAISDIVLRRMMTGWQDLNAVTLAPYQSRDMGTSEVGFEGLWSLLECGKIENLEILDLSCISNANVETMLNRVKRLQSQSQLQLQLQHQHQHQNAHLSPPSSPLNHPFSHHAAVADCYMPCPSSPSKSTATAAVAATTPTTTWTTSIIRRPIPGESVRFLTLTKYTSSPLTLPGFAGLLKLFPNLESFTFTTNFFTYDHQFQGLTLDIYQEEISMVDRIVQTEMSNRWGQDRASTGWRANWHASVTEEQRLRAGIMRSG